MAEYLANAVQTVNLGEAAIFTASIPCNKGYVFHADSRAISNPVAVEEYDNVTSTAIIDVPKGCCFNIAIRAVSGITPPATGTPAPAILMQNANLVINRIA